MTSSVDEVRFHLSKSAANASQSLTIDRSSAVVHGKGEPISLNTQSDGESLTDKVFDLSSRFSVEGQNIVPSMQFSYMNAEQTKKDLMMVLKHYQGLACNVGTHTFSNGMRKELIYLSGTIPVQVKGVFYHFPICIWLMDTHPANAPVVYVKPTANMILKPSMYVDYSGRVYLPYLHDWNPSSSDLMALIQVMTCAFGEYPPVYSVPKAQPTPYPTQPSNVMPLPGNSGSSGPGSPYVTSGNTPYPKQPESQPTSYLPYPPYNTPYPPQPMPSYNMPNQPSQMGYSSITPYPPYPPTTYPSTTQPNNSGTITEEHLRASLLSAVEEKLRRKLRDQVQQSQAELEILQQSQTELKQGETKLNQILARLEKDKLELDRSMVVMKDKEMELEKIINRLSEQESLDVDEAVIPTAPLYKQILNAFAEEASTEDAVYYMGEALRHGVIDLEVFLKQVRSLSRKQFMFRALIQKCRQKAGLAG